ncbi:MAG: hypothetical protein HYY11_03495 [Candidatus Methylomirabilis oxyfera]|nr:hypothetical protein [Candidatus Methylomirabilis oxyfera]
MTYRRLVTMGTRTTRSGGRRLLAAALLSGMAMVLVSTHDAHARTKEENCRDFGGTPTRDACAIVQKDGQVIYVPWSRVSAPTPLDPAQSGATPAQTAQGTPKPLTPGATTTPPLAPRQADLIAVSRSQSVPQFCERDRAGRFVVHVKNQGLAATPKPSRVALFFPKSGKTGFADTPILSPGAETTVYITPPAGSLLAGDNRFTITVDFDNSIPESPAGEMNNKVDSKCIG